MKRMTNSIQIYTMKFHPQRNMSVKGYLSEIEDTLHAHQRVVHGYIQTIPLVYSSPILLICNEDGKINNLPINRLLFTEDSNGELELIDTISGDCFCCRFDGVDGFESIKDEDIPIIKKYLRPVLHCEDHIAMLQEDMLMTKEEYLHELLSKVKENVFLRLTSDMPDPYTTMQAGAIMKVSFVDDVGQIHGTWLAPYKSSLAIIPEIDNFEVVDGGMLEIKRLKAKELYTSMKIDSDISQDNWYNLISAFIDDFYNRNIEEVQLKQKTWETFLGYQVSKKK